MLVGAASSCGSIEVAVTDVRLAKGASMSSRSATRRLSSRTAAGTPPHPPCAARRSSPSGTCPPGRYGARRPSTTRTATDEIDRGLFGIPLEGVGFLERRQDPAWRRRASRPPPSTTTRPTSASVSSCAVSCSRRPTMETGPVRQNRHRLRPPAADRVAARAGALVAAAFVRPPLTRLRDVLTDSSSA